MTWSPPKNFCKEDEIVYQGEDIELFHEPEPEDEMTADEEDESSVQITNQYMRRLQNSYYSSSKTRSNFQIPGN
jgi:hypothetical protein